MIGIVECAHAARRPDPVGAANLYYGNLSAAILRIDGEPKASARGLVVDEATVSANAVDDERNGG